MPFFIRYNKDQYSPQLNLVKTFIGVYIWSYGRDIFKLKHFDFGRVPHDLKDDSYIFLIKLQKIMEKLIEINYFNVYLFSPLSII